MCLPLCRACRCFRCFSGSTYIFYPAYVGLLIAIVITNFNSIAPLNRLDKSLINYAVENECSDEVLMTALRGLQQGFDISKTIYIHIALIALSIVCLAFHAGYLLFYTFIGRCLKRSVRKTYSFFSRPFRKCLKCRLCKKSQSR